MITSVKNGMTKEGFEELVFKSYGINADRPFAKDQSTLVFRHKDTEKWFAVVMNISARRLGLDEDRYTDVVNLKCSQDMICLIWKEKGIFPAYHMSKAHWVTVLLDGTVDLDTVSYLLELSFTLTDSKKHK